MAGVTSPHASKLTSGTQLPPPPDYVSSAMQISYTRAWDVAEGAYYFYTDTQSYWDLPKSHPGGEWVLVWDFAMEAPFYFHTGTHAESAVADTDGQFYAHLPTGEGAHGGHGDAQWEDATVHEDTVWLEAWDDRHSSPYYVHVLSGASQWEWPQDGYVVQYGSEDYEHWWNQGQRAFEFNGADSHFGDSSAAHDSPVQGTGEAGASASGGALAADAQVTPSSMTSSDKHLLEEAFSCAPAAAGDSKDTPVHSGEGGAKRTPPPGRTQGGSVAAMELRRAATGHGKA